MSKFSRIEKFCVGVILVCVVFMIYLGCCALVFFRKKDLPIVLNSAHDYHTAFNIIDKEYALNPKTKGEYKQFLHSNLGVKAYLYFETDNLPEKNSGVTLATIRTILVDDSLDGYEYCVTFAHELMHLKHFIQDEQFVCWETFLYLWESDELHDVGVWYAHKQLYGCYSGEYNISDLIVNYLTNK